MHRKIKTERNKVMSNTKKFSISEIGSALFDAVSNGTITTREYKNAVEAVKTIKKVL